MIKTQQDFCALIEAKRTENIRDFKGCTISSIRRWQAERASPSLKDVDNILKQNDLPSAFFYDGKLESLIDFNKKEANKLGLKITFTIEEK